MSEKRKHQYDTIAPWVNRKMSFPIINSICLYARGSRSSFGNLVESLVCDAGAREVTSNILAQNYDDHNDGIIKIHII